MSYLSNICEMTESKTAYCNLTEKTYNIQNVAFLVPFRRIDLGHFTFQSQFSRMKICEMAASKTAYCNLTEKNYNIQNVSFLVPFRHIDLGHFTFPSQ